MPATIASPPLTARPLRCRSCGTERAAAPTAICEECLGPLEPVYEPGRPLPDRETIAGRAPSLWRYKEWLPFDGDPVWSLDTGFTPLVDTPARARRRGACGAGRAQGVGLHSRRARGGEGDRDERVRRPSRASARDVRRRKPAVRAGGGSLRLGDRERQSAQLLRRRV